MRRCLKTRLMLLLWLVAALLIPSWSAGDERLKVEGQINGKAAVIALDTGSYHRLVVFKKVAERFALNIEERQGAKVACFQLKIGEGQEQVEAIVIDSPPPDIDGIIGWPALLGKIWLVLWEKETLSRISSLPPEVSSWQRMDLATDVPVAAITSGSPDGGLIYIDTGDSGGVSLSPSGWQEWLSKNPGVPMTIEGGFSPAAGGMFVAEQSWAKELTLGPLTIPRVMVARGVFKWPRLEAVLGLGALKRFEVVLDLQEHKIYLGKRTSPIALPAYNRLGATFPPKSLEAEALEARVLEGGPAYRCGIRHGDRLLKVDDMDMTQWKTNPEIWKRQFWYAKAGTKYRLELERGGRRFFVDVVLEETLPVSDE